MGKTMMKALRRSIRDISEEELREQLTEIRDKVNEALNVSAIVTPVPIRLPYAEATQPETFASSGSPNESAIAQGD